MLRHVGGSRLWREHHHDPDSWEGGCKEGEMGEIHRLESLKLLGEESRKIGFSVSCQEKWHGDHRVELCEVC